ncbi:MAG TPA: class I SAM-dependent methyltransferase [Bacteroidales bacterium]|nr:class I SAM-dependent methyltransferase [Bacteroidales bacterium]HRZ75867.1 class I SAM-dependent methyltransferase [Bacteroidales bacterium]
MAGKDFYGSIAAIYDDIFPLQKAQREFVLGLLGDLPRSATVLDIGCGTGALIVALAHHFDQTYGMDPDQDMLDHAWVKVLEEAVSTEFIPAGMLEISRHFDQASIDAAFCLGNTLVHLASEEEVAEMLQQTYGVLRPGGRLLLQIINYDRILDEGLKGLPTIETALHRFERYYDPTPEPGVLSFRTHLHIKRNGQLVAHAVPLLALRRGLLHRLLQYTGFLDLAEYGSFGGTAFTPQSQPLIITARKPSQNK